MNKISEHARTLYAVVPAAGSGQRMGAGFPKQYLSLAGKTLAEHTLGKLLSLGRIERVLVAVSPEDNFWPALSVSSHARVQTVAGGMTRAESVFNAVRKLRQQHAKPDDLVLVHDMARPCVRLSDIENLVKQCPAEGALLACPLTDTVKQESQGRSVETLDRCHIWRALTPQLFPLELLYSALNTALTDGIAVTDEASAVEKLGHRPLLVEGAADNIKVTVPADLPLADYYLQRQREEGLQWYE